VRSLQGEFSKEVNALLEQLIELRTVARKLRAFVEYFAEDILHRQDFTPDRQFAAQLSGAASSASSQVLAVRGAQVLFTTISSTGSHTQLPPSKPKWYLSCPLHPGQWPSNQPTHHQIDYNKANPFKRGLAMLGPFFVAIIFSYSNKKVKPQYKLFL
jgi:hypothetical protein